MASVKDLLDLAEEMACGIEEGRNEWMKWMSLAKGEGFNDALKIVNALGKDESLRENVRKTNGKIASCLKAYEKRLSDLSEEEREQVFGFVSWWLRVKENEKKIKRGETLKQVQRGGERRQKM